MLKICNCNDVNGTDDKLCQLNHEDLHTSCKVSANTTCRTAVAGWADEYQNSENADESDEKDPNYKISQEAHKLCKDGGIHFYILAIRKFLNVLYASSIK